MTISSTESLRKAKMEDSLFLTGFFVFDDNVPNLNGFVDMNRVGLATRAFGMRPGRGKYFDKVGRLPLFRFCLFTCSILTYSLTQLQLAHCSWINPY